VRIVEELVEIWPNEVCDSLDIRRLTAEQREELIEDLMALKDTVEEEEAYSAQEEGFA